MSQQAFEISRVVRFGWMAADAAEIYLSEGEDKYAVDAAHAPIDCASRLPLCHAACCRLRVPLTRQDLDEGVVAWDRDQPYLNAQANGRCVHCDAARRCTIYEQRPGLCRTYDCRGDDRIWVDFDRRIPNPALAALAL